MNQRKLEDIEVFANRCAFMRSVYLHGAILFDTSSAEDKARMAAVAELFFGDLNRMFVEYMILQVCKITDPAKDRKGNNHTIAFLLQHYGLTGDAAIGARLSELEGRIEAFRQRLLPARNKLISHSDRDAIMADKALGAAPQADWDQFWPDLQELINLIHGSVMGSPFLLNEVGMLSDADGLLKALKHATYFDQLLADKDRTIAARAAELGHS